MKNLWIPIFLCILVHCEPVPTQSTANSKKIIFDNHDYESIVGLAQVLPIENGVLAKLENPIIQFRQNQALMLYFDLLTEKFEYLTAKIYHCNKNWSKSLLRDIEFLDKINNYPITEFDYSINTKQPYIQYSLRLPKPILSGNFIVSVHRRGNPEDILLTRKFMVVDNISVINQQVRSSTTVAKRNINQQIDFDLNYGNIHISNPLEDISAFLLQNHKWLDAKTDLKPSLIRPNENFMEFRSLMPENNFSGWNEFRFFDLRTLNVTGRNVNRIDIASGKWRAFLGLDSSRGNQVYSQNLRDINGHLILQNTDPGSILLNSDYAVVHFSMKSNPAPGNVYVTGRFNHWQLSDKNLMEHNEQTKTYTTSILLKQGYYDYMYYLDSENSPPYYFEGSHYQTENNYEILVYCRRLGNVYDELIGYKKFNTFIQY